MCTVGMYWLNWGANFITAAGGSNHACGLYFFDFLNILHVCLPKILQEISHTTKIIPTCRHQSKNWKCPRTTPKNGVGDYILSQLKRELKQWVIDESMLDEYDAIWQCAADLCSQEHQDLIFCSSFLNIQFRCTTGNLSPTVLPELCWKISLFRVYPTKPGKALRSKQ